MRPKARFIFIVSIKLSFVQFENKPIEFSSEIKGFSVLP